MTIEVAIKILESGSEMPDYPHTSEMLDEACDMAVAALRAQQEAPTFLGFSVIDPRTGAEPDCQEIALTEDWAKNLIYCDIDCFAMTEDQHLILMDDCGNIAYPPPDRFKVIFLKGEESNAPLTLDELREMDLNEWVWIENLDTGDPFSHKSNYYQKLVTPKSDVLDGGTFWGYPGGHWHRFYWSDYGKTWLAYRRKPEEGKEVPNDN